MSDFAQVHEVELLEALNETEGWSFVVSAVVVADSRPAFIFSKRNELPINKEERVTTCESMVQEIRMQAAMNDIVVMADPYAHWSAGWSYSGDIGD
jgi:hypothetical protein